MNRSSRVLTFPCLVCWALYAASPPAPRDVFGFNPGEDYKLADHQMIVRYFEQLDRSSDRIEVMEVGKSELGKPLLMALISAPENLKQKEKFRRISESLALGRVPDEKGAARLADEGKVVVWIDSGLHASEVAHAQHAPELAYRMVSSEDPEIRKIRERVILVAIPVVNPDGLDWIAHWYRDNVGTPYERAPMPWPYHKYAGHDNNRDWFMMNLAETRHLSRVLYHQWFPQIVYNQHQAPPFPARIFVPPYAEPLNPHIPAAVMHGIGMLGMAMSERFARENKPGVLSYKTYDAWWNGGLRTAPAFHNMHGLLTETALYSFATPHTYTLEEIPRQFADGLSAREPSIFYQRPFLGGRWGTREAIDYMLTADMAVLSLAADRSADFLLKSWQMARASMAAGERGDPNAYVIRPEQWDPPAAMLMLEKLAQAGIEVHRARRAIDAGGKNYPAGAWVLRAGQPFRPYLMDLMEPQRYPTLPGEGGAPTKRPYDVAGWTLPMQMGVRVERINASFSAELERVTEFPKTGQVEGEGPVLVLDHRQNGVFPAMTELVKAGAQARWAAEGFELGGRRFAPGAVVVAGAGRATPERHGVNVARIASAPSTPGWKLATPRVALYQPWVANMDQGWTEWLFDAYRVPYTLIHNDDFRKGDLGARFDTIFFASQSAASILHGFRAGIVGGGEEERPGRAAAAQQRPQYVGGIGIEGLHHLDQFVRAGGTLVTMENSSELAISNFPLPLSNRARGAQFYCPGSLLRITVDPRQPLAYGMPEEAIAFSTGGAAFQVTLEPSLNQGEHEVRSAAQFASKDLLASGWVSGERAVLGRSAVLEARHGKGRVVLIGIRAQFRGQPHGTFKFLLNAAWLGSARWESGSAGL